jgi:alkylhydroperoxidase family enzyme
VPNVPYINTEGYEPKAVLDAVLARRGAGGLMNLDRVLLHSPELTEGWSVMFGNIRNKFTADQKLRELATCAVAKLNGAEYEFHHHKAVWEKAGATKTQIEALEKYDPSVVDLNHFDNAERAVLRLAVEMTRQVKVSPETLAAVRAVLPSERQLMEMIAVIAGYNMVSRILIVTGIEIEKA